MLTIEEVEGSSKGRALREENAVPAAVLTTTGTDAA
jgi:hypothetical protein